MKQLVEGAAAPDFSGVNQHGETIALSSFRGKKIILYFYPKDNTPGCTLESHDFRDNYKKFETLHTVIFGVSRDSVKSHDNFKCKQALPFDLISDSEERLCQLFDVLKSKNMYGKQVIGIERSTFLINAEGVLIHEWRKVKVDGHCLDVLETIGAI